MVTTPVLDLRPAPPHLSFARDPAEMAGAVARALDGPRDRERLRTLARPHDWSVLAERMVGEIERRAAVAS